MSEQSPMQQEQQELAGLEERFQWSKNQLESSLPANRVATAEEIQRAVDYTQQLVEWFRTQYGQTASSLQAAGFPGLATRLNAILTDLQQTHDIYVQMAQGSNTPPQPAVPVSPVTPTSPGSILPDPSRQGYADLSETCVHCGYYLGNLYWTLTICPRCGLLLRPSTLPQWTDSV